MRKGFLEEKGFDRSLKDGEKLDMGKGGMGCPV